MKSSINVVAFRKAGKLLCSGELVGHGCTFNPSFVPQVQFHGGPGISQGTVRSLLESRLVEYTLYQISQAVCRWIYVHRR